MKKVQLYKIMSNQIHSVTTVILAGGQGIRIGGDKGLQSLHGKPLIGWVMDAVKFDSTALLINARDPHGEYQQFGCPVVGDLMPDWPGPLAGLHAALVNSCTEYVMTVPCDTPFLPETLLARLLASQSAHASEVVVAVVCGQRQPTIALYQLNVLPKLLAYLATGKRKVGDWLECLQLSEVVFDNVEEFENINTLDDLARVQQSPLGLDRMLLIRSKKT